MRKQRTSDYYSSDTEQITSEDIDVSATMAMDFPDIFVMRPQMQTNIGGSFKEAKQLYDNGDDEVRQLLLKECSLIYECKKCRNMFRSLTQFIGHKRVFCRSSVCNNDGDIAGGGNYNGFSSNHVIATKKVSDDTSGICESVLENVIDNTSVQQTGILCENNELRDEKITGERAVTPPQAAEENEAEKIPKILSCPQERCKLSFSNTKELEKHFSEDHTNAIVFPSPVAQDSEQQTEPSVEHIIVQTRAKRTLSNTLHKCEHCGKGFERKEALVAHLMHCPVKHNILSKTLSAGVSGAMLAKRVKLQTFTEVAVEDPKTCASTNDPKESDLDKSAVLPRQPAVEVEVATKINETAPVLNQAINIKQEFIPQESIVTSTNTTSTILKKKKMKNRRPFIAKIKTSVDGSTTNEVMAQIKKENGSEIVRNIAKIKAEFCAASDARESEPKNLLSTCIYCNKSFERRAALSTHLQHCEVKNSILDRTTIYGMSSSEKRTKLVSTMDKSYKDNTRPPSFTSTPIEDPDTELLNEMFANLGRQTFGVGLKTVEIDQDDLTGSGSDDSKQDEDQEEMVDEQENSQTEVTHNASVEQSLAMEETREETVYDIATNTPEANEDDADKKSSRRVRSVPPEKRLLCRCKICNKQFTALSNVRRHISMFHHRAQRFGCTLCEYRAFRRYDIVNHLGNSHGMSGDPETMSIEYVSEQEVNYTREDVDGDIVVLDGDSKANVASASTDNLENGNENAQTPKRIKRAKTSLLAGPTTAVVATIKMTRQKLKSTQTPIEANSNGIAGKTPARRPIRNRIKPENKDFVYDLSSLVKKDINVVGAQNETTTRTLRRRNTMINSSAAARIHCIESLLGPADSRDHIRGTAQRLAASVIMSGAAASSTQPELPAERPQMRSRLLAAQRPETNSVHVIDTSQLEAARLQSTLLEDTFLEKVAKASSTSFKIKPSLSLHTSTLNWLLEKVDSSLNGKSSPSATLCSPETVIKPIHVSPPPSIPRAIAPPPTPRKRITMLERLRDDKLKYRESLLRSALEN
ncbi:uncharacterized protein [Eurosta solidaginis]|uniref:uncharacterized protein isoform X1 n=1 Tax=Eurosta solidaginis TaxID=178769 RepID=UPI0035305AFA